MQFAQTSSDSKIVFYFVLFFSLNSNNKFPALFLTLQGTALWETGNSRRGILVSSIVEIFSKSGYIREFFGALQILLVFVYSILHKTSGQNHYSVVYSSYSMQF